MCCVQYYCRALLLGILLRIPLGECIDSTDVLLTTRVLSFAELFYLISVFACGIYT